jgi:acetylornithine/succinyldiaminopimelate/putrescine aminotransferase
VLLLATAGARFARRVRGDREARAFSAALCCATGIASRDVVAQLQQAGVLVIVAGEHVLRFAPPLVVSEGELEEGVAPCCEKCSRVTRRCARRPERFGRRFIG